MKTVTRTALANIKQNRSRNILCGIAICLTCFLIFVILTLGFGLFQIQDSAVNAYYPTYHAMLRHVNADALEQLKAFDDIEEMGLREDFGQISDDDATILMITMDSAAVKLQKLELEEGEFPNAENDIVVNQNLLSELDVQAEIGDMITLPYQLYEENGLGYEKEADFRICGFAKSTDDSAEQKLYVAFFSTECMEKMIPENEREYRVMIRLSNVQDMTTDEIEKRCETIGTAIGCAEQNIVPNATYLNANYRDPSTYPIIAGIVAIVVIAGILTIYSIYYVSMIPKVQEYGKLKAMGATKKQIRQIVFREGLFVTLAAIPVGLLLGSVISEQLVIWMFRYMNNQDAYSKLALQLLEDGSVAILFPWIYLLTMIVTLLTVLFAIYSPMKKAAGISPVEAMRYQENKLLGRKKQRKGYPELNLLRLTRANLSRNRKRTMITIFTLSATGILFITMSHVLSCSKPETVAKQSIESDYQISIDNKESDKMKPDRAWNEIQKNNPMNEGFIEQLQEIDGVERVKTKSFLMGDIEGCTTEDGRFRAYITGLDRSYEKVLKEGVKEGKIEWTELEKGNQIILADGFLKHFFPKLKVGDTLHMTLDCGNQKTEQDFKIAAIGDYGDKVTSSDFVLPKSVMEGLNSNNLNRVCEIKVTESKKEKAYAALQSFAEESGYMRTDSYEEQLAVYTKQSKLLGAMAYAFLIVLGGIGVMNLLNTMVNSIYTRKRELGTMQAIGLSMRQMTRMFQMEGLFYTAGMLVLSLGIGSAAGYGVFCYAKEEHLFNIQYYQYPVWQAVLLVAVVTVIQLLLSYGVTRSLRRQSLIDQIRYSE